MKALFGEDFSKPRFIFRFAPVALATLLICLSGTSDSLFAQDEPEKAPPTTKSEYNGWFVILKTPPAAEGAKRETISAEQESALQKIKKTGKDIFGAGFEVRKKASFRLAVNALVLDIPDELAEKIKFFPEVEKVHPNYALAPTLTHSVPTIGATELHATYGITGCVKDALGECVTRARIAILDTGVDYNHPAFAGKMWENPAEKNGVPGVDDDGDGFVDNIYGADFEDCDGDPMDDGWGGLYAGHGTHVASTASAVAPDAQIIALSTPNMEVAIRAIEWAMGATKCAPCAESCAEWGPRRADVMNMSFEIPESNDPDDALCQAVNRAVTQGKIAVAVAAGNSGISSGYYTVKSPGVAKHAITVGNFHDYDTFNLGDDKMTRLSSRGYIYDGYDGNILLKPEITAPGTNICAATLSTSTLTCDGKTPYRNMVGTSMSSPHIAGAVALMYEAHPDWLGAYPERAKSALMNTTRNICPAPPTILAQGTGAVSVVPASQTPFLASPGILEFGEISRCTSPFSTDRTIEIRNLSVADDKTYDIAIDRGDLPADVSINIPPSIFVSKSSSADVAITMSSANPVVGNNRHKTADCWTGTTNCANYPLGCPYGYEGKFIFTDSDAGKFVPVPFFLGVRPPLVLTACGSTAVMPDIGCKEGGTEVTICGRGFSSDATVKFGSADPVSPTLIEPFKIVVVAPPHAEGTVDITVAACSQTEVLAGAFTYDDDPPPASDFTWTSPLYVCDNILFANASNTVGYPDTIYFWEFGDGATSSEESPTHIYTSRGTYAVKLTTQNICGESIAQKTIEVVSGSRGCYPPPPSFPPSLYKTDMNCDGCVDELIEFSYSFGSQCGDAWHDIDADFDGRGAVDGTDLSIFVNDFGAGCF